MAQEPRTPIEFQARLKRLIQDAEWGGVSKEAISAILRAEAETVKSHD